MTEYDINEKTPASTYIKVAVGEQFRIRMPEVSGRIIEPSLGWHTIVDHSVRTESHGVVEFDMVALEAGIDLVEFPLIENDWDGADDPDPEKAEPYACVLVVVDKARRAVRELAARPTGKP